jgi:hypothetical protein
MVCIIYKKQKGGTKPPSYKKCRPEGPGNALTAFYAGSDGGPFYVCDG